MPRIARVIVPGYPHHITQRGNRRQKTFFSEGDYQAYLDVMAEWCRRCGVEIWAYCLMPNHIHLIAVPSGVMKTPAVPWASRVSSSGSSSSSTASLNLENQVEKPKQKRIK